MRIKRWKWREWGQKGEKFLPIECGFCKAFIESA
jgi:hypothetical protein